MKKFLWGLAKALLVIILFCGLYVGIMLFGYQYLYPYPVGYLDEVERADGALNYRLIVQDYKQDDLLLYITRSANGSGTDIHAGTLKSKDNKYIRNFRCTPTSSAYIPVNTFSYCSAGADSYLFGGTTDQNTVKVEIIFEKSKDETKSYVMDCDEQLFYYWGFDDSWAGYDAKVYGYNSEDGVTFYYETTGLADGIAATVKE